MPSSSVVSVSVSIRSDFESGNILYQEQRPNEHDPSILDVYLHIKPDIYTELEEMAHMQYFMFQSTVTVVRDDDSTTDTETDQTTTTTTTVRYVIANAHAASYPEAWPGTTICFSKSLDSVDSWKRNTETFYTQGQLHWEHTHSFQEKEEETVYFGYFAPYSRQRHEDLLTTIQHKQQSDNNNLKLQVLGQSLQERNVSCVQVGTGTTVAWIIHRQHPGETMAEHYAEGLLQRLLRLNNDDTNNTDDNTEDSIVDQVLSKYTLYIVPCMCPDGSVLGHLRTNAKGANLNREWASSVKENGTVYEAPTLERSPEVYGVLEKMKQTGCDCFVDVHGDEELPYNFTSGANKVPNWSPRQEALLGAFTAAYSRVHPDMQQTYGYPPPESAADVAKYLNVATNQMAYRFDCLAVTLEMPFKDCRSNTDPSRGWSPARSRSLGAALVDVLDYVHPYLRDDDKWRQLPPEDAYIDTTDDYGQDRLGEEEEGFQMLKKRFYSDVHEIHKQHSPVAPPKNKFR